MSLPTIYYFNPTCELAVANGEASYVPPEILQQFERELSPLFLYVASKKDIVISNIVNDDFRERMYAWGIELPQTVALDNLSITQKYEAIAPWGWSPVVHRLFRNVKQQCSAEFHESPMFSWKAEHRDLFNRTKALQLLQSVIEYRHESFIDDSMIGTTIQSAEEIDKYWNKWQRIVLKTPFSSSGRGVYMLKRKGDFANKIAKAFKDFGCLIIEPFFQKEHDFSLQFYINPAVGVKFQGLSHFSVATGGKYAGQLIGKWSFSKSVNEYFASAHFQDLISILKEQLSQSYYAEHYKGWLGVDCMLVEDNGLKVHPVVEVNCRNTMGGLAAQIEDIIHPSRKAVFAISHHPKGINQNGINTGVKVNEGKFSAGKISLIPITSESRFCASVEIL